MTEFPPRGWEEYQARRDAVATLLDPRCHSVEWLDTLILNDDARVFASDDAVLVVTIKLYPAGATELHGLVCAGALDAILPLIDEAEAWAKSFGVTFSCISSRKAWERVLKDRGYMLHQVELRKEL